MEYQAEPFEETLAEFRRRVICKGGTVQEHYAIRKIDQLEEYILDLGVWIELAVSALDAALKDGEQESEKVWHGRLRHEVAKLCEGVLLTKPNLKRKEVAKP
jgi:hypothetical protein